MFDRKEVCQKVTELNPDLGTCGIEIDTFYSKAKRSWIIVSKKGDHDIVQGAVFFAAPAHLSRKSSNTDAPVAPWNGTY